MFGVMGLAQEEVPQSKLLCFNFEFLDDRNNSIPSFGSLGKLVQSQLFSGIHFFLSTGAVSGCFCRRVVVLYLDEFYEFSKGLFAKRRELVFNLKWYVSVWIK